MSNKGVLVLLLLLSLALSGCGKQRSNNSNLRSNEEIDLRDKRIIVMVYGEKILSTCMIQPSIWKIIRCILFWFLQITWENSSTVL